MSQQEILDFLASHPGWHRARDIRAGMGKGESAGFKYSMRTLLRLGEVEADMVLHRGCQPRYRAVIKVETYI